MSRGPALGVYGVVGGGIYWIMPQLRLDESPVCHRDPLESPGTIRERTWSRNEMVVLAAIIATGLALRLAWLGRNSLWFDEVWVVWVVRHPWNELFPLLKATDAHPPLYFLLMKGWVAAAGSGEVALRLPSACFGAATVGLTYALARHVGTSTVALLSALLVAGSPFAVMAGQDARMYALLGMLAVASTLALASAAARGGAVRWAGYGACALLLAYTHYFGALVLIAHAAWVLGWGRRHLGAWTLTMLGAALLYLPWLPAMWHQLTAGNAWPWYRRDMVFVDLGDLIALLAFGGSLFGTGSYFFPGSAALAVQILLVLPFLAAAAAGVRALASQEARRLALVGLPIAVAVAAGVGLPLARLTVYPRWFSYLAPFVAIVLGAGIAWAADVAQARRREAMVLLTAALLAFSVPVLTRYYLDPRFRPYPWRAAAALVKHEARPGDFFLYVNTPAEIAFSYYFPGARPSWTLHLESSSPDNPGELTAAAAQGLARRHPRVWVIATMPFSAEAQHHLLVSLNAAFHVVGGRAYPAVWVHLLRANSSPPR